MKEREEAREEETLRGGGGEQRKYSCDASLAKHFCNPY